jgi:hypothetical protein
MYNYIIGHCKLYDKAQDEARNRYLSLLRFTKKLVVVNIWGERIGGFLRKIQLGFTKDM